MAPPIRPYVRINHLQNIKHYESIDGVDQDLYNNLRFVYEKAAFLAFIERTGTSKTLDRFQR
jgi:hypothetical protein